MITFKDDDRALNEFRKKEEEDLAEILASKYALPYINLSGIPIETDALRLVPEEEAREAHLAPFSISGKVLKIALLSPNDPKALRVVEGVRSGGYEPTLYMASRRSLEKAWSRYEDVMDVEEVEAGVVGISGEGVEKFKSDHPDASAVRAYLEKEVRGGRDVSDLVEALLQSAVAQGASDLHIEPQEGSVQVRLRLDGILVPVLETDFETHSRILSRLKILSGVKINVASEPQDGRFSIRIGGSEIEVRTSIIPGAFGESVVMRLLNPDATEVSIETLGFDEVLLSKIKEELKKPNGMILTTGPTGSGKTTALYAFLKMVYEPGIKIITIENPVEYRLPGVVQTQVNHEKGYDFYEGLKSSLRQDPDIIMVGEIRDEDTAKTAVQAALTGHLVFSTLHTNDAVGAIPRMRDLDVKEDVLGASLNVILAQRLVRKLKPEGSTEVPMTDQERSLIESVMKDVEGARWRPLFERGVLRKPKEGLAEHECYAGRTGIFEAVIVDQEVEDLIRAQASLVEIDAKGRKKYGILSLREHGVLNVLQGITDLNELERVVSLLD
jgi:type IV pilus assembly protein PilB